MIKIIIKETLIVKNLSFELMEKVQADLTFDNPDHISRQRHGKFIPANLPRYLYFYAKTGPTLYAPRGYMNTLLKHVKSDKHEIIDRTVAPPIEINFTSVRRDYQITATDAVLDKRYGVLKAQTGAGKTLMGIYIASVRKVRTLVLVHNKELLEQWQEAFRKHTDITEFGVIGESKFSIKDITVGIINSVYNNLEKVRGQFGFVITDECHRTPGVSWTITVNGLNPKYQLGLSATPYRRDNLTKAIFILNGPLLHEVDKAHLESTGAVLIPRVVPVGTQFRAPSDRMEYSELIAKLVTDQKRNRLIALKVYDEFIRYKEPIMVVSDRVSHCEELLDLIQSVPGAKPVLVSGQQSKAYRKDAVEGLKRGEYNILVATASLLGEGFDAPMLSALFMATPIKFTGRLTQIVGRILRPSGSGEMPRIYDFRDLSVKVLQLSGYHRDRLYKKMGWMK